MAIIEQGILGGFSGRVGTVVGYHRHGAWFVRAYQPHINDRKSAAQLEQRSRFKAMIQFASPATPLLRIGLRQMADREGITEGNVFLKINKACFQNLNNQNNPITPNPITPTTPINQITPTILYPSLQFSRGPLAAPRALEYSLAGALCTVRWQRSGGSLTDTLHIYAYCPATGTGICLTARRSQGRLRALLPEGFAGQELHVWAFVQGRGGAVSGTEYVREDESDSTHSDAEGCTPLPDLSWEAKERVPTRFLSATLGTPSSSQIHNLQSDRLCSNLFNLHRTPAAPKNPCGGYSFLLQSRP
ncbi:MAG: hypothetical protein J6I49_07535 [Bacteroidales bacterium]|nr:hypothetical protein [Bacteroidales bacterium]